MCIHKYSQEEREREREREKERREREARERKRERERERERKRESERERKRWDLDDFLDELDSVVNPHRDRRLRVVALTLPWVCSWAQSICAHHFAAPGPFFAPKLTDLYRMPGMLT